MQLRQLRNIILATSALAVMASAAAAPVSVGYTSGTNGPQFFYADTFSQSGQSGSLTLDTAGTVTQTINLATLNVGISGDVNDTTPMNLNFDLTLDGVTHTLVQSGTWSITPAQDSVLALAAANPVLFATSLGNWSVSLNPFSIIATATGDFRAEVSADFTAVPEPGSMALAGLALAALALRRRKRL